MHTSNYPSLTDANRSTFEDLTKIMAAARRGKSDHEMIKAIYRVAEKHNIDAWDIEDAATVYNQEIKQIA